jgi:hypothetical protein
LLRAAEIIRSGAARILRLSEFHELTVFPNGKHDDQADSTAQFLDWFKKPFPGQGLYEYYRRRAQELKEQRKPQPIKTVWAIGSMEWQAEQEKAGRTAASALEPLCGLGGRPRFGRWFAW